MTRGSWWEWAIVLVLVFLVAAGGVFFGNASTTSSSSHALGEGSTTTQPAISSDYLATGPDYVDFIQWNDSAGKLHGLAEFVTTQGTAPTLSTTTSSLVVDGTLSGTDISLGFNGAPQAYGTTSGDSFTLNFAQPQGTMAPVTFRAASIDQYNSALSHLAQRITSENDRARVQTPATKRQTVDSDVAQVASDLTTLSQDEASINGLVQPIPNDLQDEVRDLSSTLAAEQQVSTDAQGGTTGPGSTTCSDAQSVVAEAHIVENDSQAVEGDVQTVEGASASPSGVGALRADIDNLNLDFSQFQSDQAKLPRYHPAQAPTKQEVSQSVAAANEAISSALSTANGYIDTANSGVTQAFQYVAQAFQTGACGSAPTAPAPLGYIS